MTYPFLSEDWMTAARGIREKYADEVPDIPASISINLTILDVPFDDGEIRCHLDTSEGSIVLELGELDDAQTTITTDYDTAKALFVYQDQAVAMQAFMAGKIKVQGDMMQMLAMQTAIPNSEFSEKVAAEVQAITAE